MYAAEYDTATLFHIFSATPDRLSDTEKYKECFSMDSECHISKYNFHLICVIHSNILPPALPVSLRDLQISVHFLKIHSQMAGHQKSPP